MPDDAIATVPDDFQEKGIIGQPLRSMVQSSQCGQMEEQCQPTFGLTDEYIYMGW